MDKEKTKQEKKKGFLCQDMAWNVTQHHRAVICSFKSFFSSITWVVNAGWNGPLKEIFWIIWCAVVLGTCPSSLPTVDASWHVLSFGKQRGAPAQKLRNVHLKMAVKCCIQNVFIALLCCQTAFSDRKWQLHEINITFSEGTKLHGWNQ